MTIAILAWGSLICNPGTLHIETLWLQISPYFHLLHASGNYLKANDQHELMLAALRARDGVAVSLALRDDIDVAYRVLASLLSAKGIGLSYASRRAAHARQGRDRQAE